MNGLIPQLIKTGDDVFKLTEISSMAEAEMDVLQQQSSASSVLGAAWDPNYCKEWDDQKATQQCILRIKRILTGGGEYSSMALADGDANVSKKPKMDAFQQKWSTSLLLGAAWDPNYCKTWDDQKVTQPCILRIKKDIMNIYLEPPPGMCIVPEEDITKVHALITGPFDTPYEGGFFHFLIRFPPDYPIRPPRVKLVTTGDGKVRFNPNLYRNGKVCLSILGTWTGPAWSPAQCLSSVLISIQSLLNEKPYHNEPGFEQERQPGDCQRYNDIIRHETIRVAVCDMLDNPHSSMPDPLKEVMDKSFPEFYEYYTTTVKDRQHLSGNTMQDPYGERRGKFDYTALLARLEKIKHRLDESNIDNKGSDLDSSSGPSDSEVENTSTSASTATTTSTSSATAGNKSLRL